MDIVEEVGSLKEGEPFNYKCTADLESAGDYFLVRGKLPNRAISTFFISKLEIKNVSPTSKYPEEMDD